MSHKTKNEWIFKIETFLAKNNTTYVAKVYDDDKASLLFACDVFRRRNCTVGINIDVTSGTKTALSVSIAHEPSKTVTLRKEDNPQAIIRSIDSNWKYVTLRTCGTVINNMFVVIDHLMNNGWYVKKLFLGSLAQYVDNIKRNNTTFHVELQHGLDMSSTPFEI